MSYGKYDRESCSAFVYVVSVEQLTDILDGKCVDRNWNWDSWKIK